ncbi:MAG: carbohydrate ABC transporter permease, partial [Candidatus Bathyarchaeia archaeon]
FTNPSNIKAIANSIIVALSGTGLAIVLGYPVAYSISRGVARWRFFMFMAMIPRAIPPVVLAIPLLVFYSALGFLDTLHGLSLIYAVISVFFIIWMLKPFIDSIPIALEEAALLDGVSRFTTPFRIVLPLVRGGLGAAAVLVFILNWSEFLFALILSRVNARTVPVQLMILNPMGASPATEGVVAALSSLVIIPFFATVYFFFKYLLKGVSGGIRGE